MIPALPYTRKGYREGKFKKYEYTYDEYNDIYICPNEKDLIPTGRIDKNGYMVYKSDSKDCINCPRTRYTITSTDTTLKKDGNG